MKKGPLPKTIILLERFAADLPRAEGALFVSLDPSASYELSRQGLPYRILEDFYSEYDLRRGEDRYFADQMQWFDEIDRLFQTHSQLCRTYSVRLARANYLRIKYCVDALLINDFILHSFFKEVMSSHVEKIIYFAAAKPRNAAFSFFKFKDWNRWLFGEQLRLYCEKYRVVFAYKAPDNEFEKGNYATSMACASTAKIFIKKISTALKYRKFSHGTRMSGSNFLFMHAGGPDVDSPIRDLIGQGARVFVMEGRCVFEESSPIRPQVPFPKVSALSLKSVADDCATASKSLAQSCGIIRWIRERSSVDASLLILPFFRQFFQVEAVAMLQNALEMKAFIERHRIHFVCARANSDMESMGPIIAAKYFGAAKCVCFSHTHLAVDNKALGIFDRETYHATFARDTVSEDYLKNFSFEGVSDDCVVSRSVHYLRSFKKSVPRGGKRRRGIVAYIEKKFPDRVRSLNNMIYPLAWYYEFQKSLIDYFARRADFKFVYKHADSVGQAWARNSTISYIRDKRAPNISVSKEEFSKVLASVDRVIVDYPSGALFESVVVGKPVLCFYADYLSVNEFARNLFGKSLQPFSDASAAIKLIDDFLYSDQKQFIVDLPLDHDDFVDVFNRAFSAPISN